VDGLEGEKARISVINNGDEESVLAAISDSTGNPRDPRYVFCPSRLFVDRRLHSFLTSMCLPRNRTHEKRAMAFGLAACGSSLGAVLFPIIHMKLVNKINYR